MNINKFYLRQVFSELIPIYPLYLLLFESKGLSLSDISMLLAIWSLPAVILEVPTGIMADRFSRRIMILLGSLLKAACFFIWIFSDGFALYAIGFILWGIGGAFISGSEEALLFDSLKMEGKEDSYDRVLGKGRFLSGLSTVIASVSGGIIGMRFGFFYALLVSVIAGLISAGVAFTYQEVNLYKQYALKNEAGHKETLREAIDFIGRNREILLLSFLAVMVIGTAGVLDEYDQLIAENYGLSIAVIGIWTSIRFVLIAFGSYLAHVIKSFIERILHTKNRIYVVGFLCLFAALCLAMAGLVRNIGIMGIYGLYYLLMSTSDVLQEDYIQQKIEGEGRSTVHSLLSLSLNLYGILFYWCIGLILKRIDLHGVLVVVASYLTILTVFFMSLYSRIRENKV